MLLNSSILNILIVRSIEIKATFQKVQVFIREVRPKFPKFSMKSVIL